MRTRNLIIFLIFLSTNIFAWSTNADQKVQDLKDDVVDAKDVVKKRIDEVKNVDKSVEKWTKGKYEAAKAGMSPKAQTRSKEAQDLALVINTFAEYSSSLGLPDDIQNKVNSTVGGYNLWLNGDLKAAFGQGAMEFLPKSVKKYLPLCYEKEKLTDGVVFDPCSLIPDIDADACRVLPNIPGYTKLSLLTDDLTKAVYEETGTKLPLGKALREMCKKRLDAKKKNPNDKTSPAEKLKNNNPKGAREDLIKSSTNANVKEIVKHSKILSTKSLSKIKLVKKDSDGKTISFNPFKDLNKNDLQSEEVRYYLEELATKSALEGGSQQDTKKIIKVLAMNPKAVNTTFENKGQYEEGKSIMASSIYNTYKLVFDYDSIIEDALKTTKDDPSGTSDLIKIYEDKYADLLKDWVNSEKAHLISISKGYNTPTKDLVDSIAKGSKNELFTRISTVTKINKQIEQQAYDIAMIKVKALKMKKKFSVDLKIAIIGAKEFDMNGARIAAGLEPYPDVKDPLEAMKEMATTVAKDEVKKQIEIELKYLSPIN